MLFGLDRIGSVGKIQYKSMRYLTATALFSVLLSSAAFAQLEDLERLEQIQQELDRTQEGLFDLELEYGRLDRRLLEPLDQYSLALIENGRYGDAHNVLDQAIQIIRVSEGLYSPTQFPLLVRHIENYINRGDWTNAGELIEHLNWLLSRSENPVNEELITTILDLVDIHLWGVADDVAINQSTHFRQAERLTNMASRIARFNYEEGDSRVPEVMYKKVVQMYLQSVAVEVGGKTGISLRSYSSIGYAVSRSDARLSLYYSGLRSLASIQSFYADNEKPNIEGTGLAFFYLGDWEVIFGNPGAAREAYEYGNQLLLAAGHSQETINRYTSQPKQLPLLEFHGSLENALAENSESTSNNEEGSSSNFTFRQWSAQFPRTISPVSYGMREIDMERSEYAMFSFNLMGLDQIGRWYKGRYKNNLSSPQDLELVNRQISSSVDWFELTESIKDFHFRPQLVNGEAQTVSATLYYQLAE
ncbi:MAG: hypothetical protein GKR91_08130 [Pseudomonadales bacterium]|nr:hypothetical protein [Pseudomonadales bacterium]